MDTKYDETTTPQDYWDEDEPPEWATERNGAAGYVSPSPELPLPPRKRSENPRSDAIEKHWNVSTDGFFNMLPHDMYEAVTPNDRALDLCLRHIAGQNLICWPPRKRIMQLSGLTESEVRTSEAHLVDGEWLAMEEWKSMAGDRAPYCYILYPLCRRYTINDLAVRTPYGGWHVPKELQNVA